MRYLEPIGIGVISGLLTFIVAWLMKRFTSDTLIPLYVRHFYAGANVTGTYQGNHIENGTNYGFKLSLTQRGKRIEGTFTAHDVQPEGTTTTKQYVLSGEISNNYMLLRYFGDDKVFGAGAFLLQCSGTGRFLDGSMLYLSTKKNTTGAANNLRLDRTFE